MSGADSACVPLRLAMLAWVSWRGASQVRLPAPHALRLDSQRSAFDRVGEALRGDGDWPDYDDGAAGALIAV
ncbi:hypothetical protein [Streptomyces sp. CC228A]|uniref:hypothetical protein n=1 Tax=Streptomyces sp. CC228A TaxID=2898186 RepID=UPI001F405050|nr:hypothetical protein [Streptomyces sp. CC228A]